MASEINIYKDSRKKAGLTQEQASEKAFMSEDKIGNFESGKTTPKPDDVMNLAKAYNDMSLCNKYCTQECAIGKSYIPKVEVKNLPELTISVLAALNAISSETSRIIEIAEDGKVTPDEIPDFDKILKKLEKIEMSIAAFKLWAKQEVSPL